MAPWEAWAVAIEALSWMELRGLSERMALATSARQLGVGDPETLGMAHRMVCETTRKKNLIDRLVNKALHPSVITEFPLGVQAFLRLYTHEVKFAEVDRDDAVEIARVGRSILGWRKLEPVEEALGRILGITVGELLHGLSDEEKIALTTYHPTWFVRYCIRLLGRGEALKLLSANTKPPPVYVRLNTLKGSEEALVRRLEAEGVRLEEAGLEAVYRVSETRKPLVRTRAFRSGLFYIQDKASCLAVLVANPAPGDVVLDVCAAPGAKTTHIAQLMGNRGEIYSVDYSRRRMGVWLREVGRMGVQVAHPIIADACHLPLNVEADLVILDPPCTSTGAFARAPSAKWRLTRRSINGMAKLQWEMLNASARHVKPGGALVYTTCSITVEENEVLVERFLRLNPDFRLVDAEPRVGVPGLRGLWKCQRLYTHLHGCNGYFIARMVREA